MTELRARDLEICDCGTDSESSVDYPDFAIDVAAQVSSGKADRGVLMCGTGIGMSMAANKFPGVRAAVVHDSFTAEMSRRHNDANVLCMGGRVLSPVAAAALLRLWLETPFEGGRHLTRIRKVDSAGDAAKAGEGCA
jgi:ribose 5-phosphate isomerase B